MHVQYRNSSYFGGFSDYMRHGYGLLVLDNSSILMAKWDRGHIDGHYAFSADRIRAFGSMNRGKLEGFNILCTRHSIINMKNEQERTIYGMFRDNKPYGKCLVIENDSVIVVHYSSGEVKEISERKPLRDREFSEMLRNTFPKYLYSLEQYLIELFKSASVEGQNQESPNRYLPMITKYEDGYTFYGYCEAYQQNKTFGFVMMKNQIVSVGEHVEDFLQGIGRLYQNDTIIQDGVFRGGKLNGIGISYNKVGHKYIIGEHGNENSTFEKGFGFPQKEISEIRKEFHLRSIYFYNDIVILSIGALVEGIVANALRINQMNNDASSLRFSSIKKNRSHSRGLAERSPLKQKLDRYEEESDHIDDPTPIKNKPNQYNPTEYRPVKYFQSDHQDDEPSNKKKLRNNPSQKYTRLSKQDPKVPKRQVSTNIRNTKDLVRELDEKQRTRRNYLDQIYKEAKLYNKK